MNPICPTGTAEAALASPWRVAARAGLRFAEAGTTDAPAFLSLHGGLGGWEQSAVLDRALFGSPEGRRALAISRPGYPGSTREGAGDPEAQARACLRLLDACAIDRAIVAAVSGGGPIALELARLAPERCRALILVSACTGAMTSPVPPAMRLVLAARRFRPLVAWMASKMEKAPIRDAALAAALAADPDANALHAAMRASLVDDLAARLDGLAADIVLCRHATAPKPGEIAVPTLLVHARDDSVVPPALAEQAAAAIASATTLVFPDGGHAVLFTRLAEIRRAVATLLAAV